jgi:hypothetical protein
MEYTKWDYYKKQFKHGQISSLELAQYHEAKEMVELKYLKARFKLLEYYLKYFKVQGTLVKELFSQS